MDIIYIEHTPFGRFVYDPQSNEGVSYATDVGPAVLKMDEDYNPFTNPEARKITLEADQFEKLKEAAQSRDGKGCQQILEQIVANDLHS